MKKILFLMLTLLLWSAANVAQVTIGSDAEPHPGAVLDLQSTTQGVLLPNVTLSSDITDFAMSGEKTAAKGLIVYSNGDTPGLYMWDGVQWNRLNSCALPATPASISFSPTITNPVNPNALITITASAVASATPISYDWKLPDSLEIEGIADDRSIKVRVKKTTAGTIDASHISVKAVNTCGASARMNATGTIEIQTIAPAQPTFSIPRTTVNANGTVTLTCQDVGADQYDWTFPTQFTGTTPTTLNAIQLQANVDGKYAAQLFTVKAANMYGITDARTASGDSIIVGNCTGAPVIDSVTLWNSTRLVGGDRYVNLYVKATGTVNYNVKLPSGLTLTEIVNNSVYFTMDKPGNYKGSDVVLTVINDCGTTTGTFGDGILHVVHYGSPGSDMTIGNNTYQTWVIPNVGTLMTGFSKEGTPSYSSAPGDPSDTRFGYYYGNETASACPAPWQVLTLADATTIAQMHHSGSSDLADQLSMNFTLGAYNASGNPTQTGSYGYAYLQAGSRIRWGAVGSVWTIAESDGSYAFLVKCILK